MSEILHDLQDILQVQESNGCTFSYAYIDSKMARRLLSLSEGNRPISNKCVAKYAKHMENGTWESDHPTQFIMFDNDGVLINGHHTLRAVVKSGVTTKLFFMFNMVRSPHIDSGRMRSEADRFSIMYGDMDGRFHYKRAVAVCNVLSSFGIVNLVTDNERWNYIHENEVFFNTINQMTGHAGTGLSTAPVYAAIYVAAKNGANPATLAHFWSVLQAGFSELVEDRPVLKLREWLKDYRIARNSKAYRQDVLNTVSDTLCKWLNHQAINRIQTVPEFHAWAPAN